MKTPKTYTDAFNEVWALYPRHVGKFYAFKKFYQLEVNEPETIDLLINYIKINQWAEDKKFIPHLATVISQRRWDDVEEIQEQQDHSVAEKAWERLLNHVQRYGTQFGPDLPEDLAVVTRKLGGVREVGMWKDYELKGKKLTFIKIYLTYV